MDTFSHPWAYIPLPILVFVLGLLATFLIKQWQLKSKMESNQRFIIFWIDAIKESIEKQASGLKKFADEIKKADPMPIGLTKINLHIDKLRAITPIEMVQTFATNKHTKKNIKLKLLYHLASDVDFLDNAQISAFELLDKSNAYSSQNFKEWEDNILAFHDWKRKMIEDVGANLSANEFLKEVVSLHNEWVEFAKQFKLKDSKPLEHMKIHFLDKVDLILRKHFNINPSNPQMLELSKLVSRLNQTYDRRIANMEVFSNHFEDLGEKINSTYMRMALTKNRIAKLKFKCFLFLD